MTLAKIFVDVLDTPHIAGEFRVDEAYEDNQEQRRIWNNPLIVHHVTSDIVLPPIIAMTIFGYPSSFSVVCSQNGFGKCFLHWPFCMQGAFVF